MSSEYDELMGTGYAPPTETKPEEEFFHSIYISGVMRKNHIGIVEEIGKLQIRGVQYNLSELYFIITHVKPVLVKKEKVNDKDRITCFSYQNTNPWKGKGGRICPTNRDDRDNTPACQGCRGEIIVSGILCDKSGKPIMTEGKPVFVFIRGKGIKSLAVYKYLETVTKMEIEPPIFPDNPTLEKMVAKNKRHVTRVSVTTADSKHGIKTVFNLEIGDRLNDEFVKEVLKIQKRTIGQFNEKFDWSNKTQMTDSAEGESTGYVPENQPETQPETQSNQTTQEDFSFDNIKF